jgi:hypothetical protein
MWWRVHIDLIGPLPESSVGNKYIFLAVCALSKYVEAQVCNEDEHCSGHGTTSDSNRFDGCDCECDELYTSQPDCSVRDLAIATNNGFSMTATNFTLTFDMENYYAGDKTLYISVISWEDRHNITNEEIMREGEGNCTKIILQSEEERVVTVDCDLIPGQDNAVVLVIGQQREPILTVRMYYAPSCDGLISNQASNAEIINCLYHRNMATKIEIERLNQELQEIVQEKEMKIRNSENVRNK